ncbi:CocE/NonD family hydrolase [Trebonia kvetii]|nr:CocE/NonD family hydrolase [Trebonia kvetii]
MIDVSRRLQSVYVPAADGVRLAVDVWLPVERTAAGGAVGTVMRVTRYHRAEAPQGPEPAADTNAAAGDLFNRAGFALVVVDARGTGASFGTRAGELSEREIKDYGELIDWVAAQPWSNGRVGVYGTSYEGQAAELIAGLGNAHLVAVAALFSPYDPYRELFYPGGCGTGGRYARWMYESQLKDGIAGALDRLAALTGQPAETIALPSPVKPVDGPDGRALLDAAIGEHQANTDVHALMGRVPFRDDRVTGLDWEAAAPASGAAAAFRGVPMLVRAGWLDGGFAAGALARFAARAGHQQVEIGPWGHGGGSLADTLRPSFTAEHDPLSIASQDRRLVEFLARYLERDREVAGGSTLTFGTLGIGEWHTVTRWPPADTGTQRWYLGPMAGLTREAGPAATVTHRADVTASTGATNRWLAIDLDKAPGYPGRRDADDSLLTFTSGPLPADVHVLGFPVVTVRLATSGTDGAVYVYLEAVGPDADVSYLTEGCLRFLHRRAAGAAEPARLGVPRTFARPDALPVVPGTPMDLAVPLLPVSAVVPAGHRVRVAITGHDASCFTRYGPAEETFTLSLGGDSHLDLPVRSG